MVELIDFLADLLELPKIDFDDRYGTLLYFMTTENLTSTYSLHSHLVNMALKRDTDWKDVEATIAYKNIHRRMKLLYNVRIIDEVSPTIRTPHGRIDYRLTDKGLIYLISRGFSIYHIPEGSHFNIYDSSLFKVFVNPIFEEATMKTRTPILSQYLDDYMFEISINIHFWLQPVIFKKYGFNPDKSLSSQVDNVNNSLPVKALAFTLKSIMRSYLFLLASMKENPAILEMRIADQIMFHDLKNQKVEGNELKLVIEDDKLRSLNLLSKDKKFLRALKETEMDFKKGYDKIIGLSKANKDPLQKQKKPT